jgi:hypothetical protein
MRRLALRAVVPVVLLAALGGYAAEAATSAQAAAPAGAPGWRIA